MTGADVFTRGDRIGDYQILQRLRGGGMATLYLGRRHGVAGVSRPVVIKVIHPHLAEEDLIVRMFIDEARISSHISHANVVYVETFGEHRGTYFLVMEYVDGVSVDQLLRTMSRAQERLAPEVAVHIALEAAAGLHAAHETVADDGIPLGIVHRDVSPSNILLTRDGHIKVIDFGIAKARNRLGVTEGGPSLKGKVRYMSPEQAWGRDDLDRRTDVYALGVVLWELLTCRPLYKGGDDLAVLEAVRNPEVPPPSQFNPAVSPELDRVVLHATAPAREERLSTAQELRRHLLQAVPAAAALDEDRLPELVARVRTVFGAVVISDPEEDKATTPANPMAVTQQSPVPAEGRSPDSSVGGGAGELHALPPRRAGWRALGALALAGGIVAAVLIARGGGSDDRAATAAAPPVTAPRVATPPPDATPVVEPVEPQDAAPLETVGVPVDATPVARPRHRPSRPADPTRTLDLDGAVLAVEPDPQRPRPPTKRPKKPRNEVHVDGTVLAE